MNTYNMPETVRSTRLHAHALRAACKEYLHVLLVLQYKLSGWCVACLDDLVGGWDHLFGVFCLFSQWEPERKEKRFFSSLPSQSWSNAENCPSWTLLMERREKSEQWKKSLGTTGVDSAPGVSHPCPCQQGARHQGSFLDRQETDTSKAQFPY